MSDRRPAPLTPSDADLRDFTFMPLDVVRFAQSDLVALEEPEAVVAAILLWGASWHQVPAGSLTNDERTLSRLAGYRRPGEDWSRVRQGALRGWIECSDGRLYHPVVAEKVGESWEGRLKAWHRSYCAAIRQHNGRYPDDKRESPTFEEWRDAGRPREVKRAPPARQGDLPLPEKPEESRVTGDGVTRDTDASHAILAHQGTGTGTGTDKGQGQGQGESYNKRSTSAADEPLLDATLRYGRLGGLTSLNPAYPKPFAREMDVVKGWRTDGIPDELIVAEITKKLERTTDESIGSFRFYDGAIRKAFARTAAGKPKPPPGPPPKPIRTRDDADARMAKLRTELQAATGAKVYGQHFGPTAVAFHLNDTALEVVTRNAFQRGWIEEHYGRTIATIAEPLFGVPLRFTTE